MIIEELIMINSFQKAMPLNGLWFQEEILNLSEQANKNDIYLFENVKEHRSVLEYERLLYNRLYEWDLSGFKLALLSFMQPIRFAVHKLRLFIPSFKRKLRTKYRRLNLTQPHS